jgi:hypothetical protein
MSVAGQRTTSGNLSAVGDGGWFGSMEALQSLEERRRRSHSVHEPFQTFADGWTQRARPKEDRSKEQRPVQYCTYIVNF